TILRNSAWPNVRLSAKSRPVQEPLLLLFPRFRRRSPGGFVRAALFMRPAFFRMATPRRFLMSMSRRFFGRRQYHRARRIPFCRCDHPFIIQLPLRQVGGDDLDHHLVAHAELPSAAAAHEAIVAFDMAEI